MAAKSFAEVIEGHFGAYLARAVRWVDGDEPWPTILAAAKADPGVPLARALGAWVAEDIVAEGRPQGAAQPSDLRQRALAAERAIGEAVVALSAQAANPTASPSATEVSETVMDVLSGETDALVDALRAGFAKASGAPLVGVRRQLAFDDLEPEGQRNERVRFTRPVTPPPGLALEPVAHLRQDVSRLKHYALRDALSRGGRGLSVSASSSAFKVVRPAVSLDGDLTEVRAMSGVANAADAWADEVRAALAAGFEERLRVRQSPTLAGPPTDVPSILRCLEIERAAADLKGALSHDPEAAIIPAEGLLALVVAAPLPAGGLTP